MVEIKHWTVNGGYKGSGWWDDRVVGERVVSWVKVGVGSYCDGGQFCKLMHLFLYEIAQPRKMSRSHAHKQL